VLCCGMQHVVFGSVKDGMDVVKKIERWETCTPVELPFIWVQLTEEPQMNMHQPLMGLSLAVTATAAAAARQARRSWLLIAASCRRWLVTKPGAVQQSRAGIDMIVCKIMHLLDNTC
jgi:hypothetical protein